MPDSQKISDRQHIKHLKACIAYYNREHPGSELIAIFEADLLKLLREAEQRKTGPKLPVNKSVRSI
jgi:hypothetical protein